VTAGACNHCCTPDKKTEGKAVQHTKSIEVAAAEGGKKCDGGAIITTYTFPTITLTSGMGT
jgi:hypothetical protein